jgi:NAD(P)-dependent dehydrogenase (short-subunit alcohol dehydrogenase family)
LSSGLFSRCKSPIRRRHRTKAIDPSCTGGWGRRAIGVALDVADEQQVDAGTGSAIKAFGALDILVSNASKSSLPSSI